MAAFDFPAGPNPGDVFTDPSGASYTYNGYAWMGGAANSLGALVVSDTPPAAPANNSLWFESDTGMLFLRYNDGNSSQWVQLNALPNGAGYMPLQGVTDGSNAPAGQIGEVISSVVLSPGVTLTNSAVANITNIALTPGDWDVCGMVTISYGTGGGNTGIGAIGPTSAVLPAAAGINTSRAQLSSAVPASNGSWIPLRTCRISLTATTTYYLMVWAAFASGTVTAFGDIMARRVR
jgi:hypothetical protein